MSIGKGILPPSQHEGHGHVEVDHGRFEHKRREPRLCGGGPQGDGGSHRAAPKHGLERARLGRSGRSRSARNSSQVWISPASRPPNVAKGPSLWP